MSHKQLLIIGDDKEFLEKFEKIFSSTYILIKPDSSVHKIDFISKNYKNLAAIFFIQNEKSKGKFSTLRKMQENDILRHVPTFLVVDRDHPHFIEEAYQRGITDIVQKPFNDTVIRHRITNVIELFTNRYQIEKLFNEQSDLITRQLKELEKNQWAIIETLGNALESRDVESGDHVYRVKSVTRTLAVDLAVSHPEYMLNGTKIDLITLASTLHDIGKIAIPDNILKKPESDGRFTNEEFSIMKNHTVEGCKVIDSIPDFKDSPLYPYCYEICRHHHERWNGKGYPDGLAGNTIPISAQLVSIADVYDALISKRVYKPQFTHEKACEMIINGECGSFNPDLLECFKNTSNKIYELYYANNHHINS